jgi:tellurite resistance protein TerC
VSRQTESSIVAVAGDAQTRFTARAAAAVQRPKRISLFDMSTSNAFAILGLRALYFLLAGMVERFVHLKLGLAAVLVFVGAKMLATDLYTVPIWASLAVIVLLIGTSIAASLRTVQRAESLPAANP